MHMPSGHLSLYLSLDLLDVEPRAVSASVVKHKLVVCGSRLPSSNGNRLRCQRRIHVLPNTRATTSSLGSAYCSQQRPSYRTTIYLNLNKPFAIVTGISCENFPDGRERQIEMRLAIRRCMRKSDGCHPVTHSLALGRYYAD